MLTNRHRPFTASHWIALRPARFYAAQVMSRDILCFEEVVTVDEVVRVLRCADHSAYPVVGNKACAA
jgi:predicted transcriptional regulator